MTDPGLRGGVGVLKWSVTPSTSAVLLTLGPAGAVRSGIEWKPGGWLIVEFAIAVAVKNGVSV